MNFGLIIIGDEILSGKREDKHLPKVIELLGSVRPGSRQIKLGLLRVPLSLRQIVFGVGHPVVGVSKLTGPLRSVPLRRRQLVARIGQTLLGVLHATSRVGNTPVSFRQGPGRRRNTLVRGLHALLGRRHRLGRLVDRHLRIE